MQLCISLMHGVWCILLLETLCLTDALISLDEWHVAAQHSIGQCSSSLHPTQMYPRCQQCTVAGPCSAHVLCICCPVTERLLATLGYLQDCPADTYTGYCFS